MSFLEIDKAINKHLFETLDEMKLNVAKDLNIPEDNVNFIYHETYTEISVEKDGTELHVIVRIWGDRNK